MSSKPKGISEARLQMHDTEGDSPISEHYHCHLQESARLRHWFQEHILDDCYGARQYIRPARNYT